MDIEREIKQLNLFAQAFHGTVGKFGDALKFGYLPTVTECPIGTYTTTYDEAGCKALRDYLRTSARLLHVVIPGLWEQTEDMQAQRIDMESRKVFKPSEREGLLPKRSPW